MKNTNNIIRIIEDNLGEIKSDIHHTWRNITEDEIKSICGYQDFLNQLHLKNLSCG